MECKLLNKVDKEGNKQKRDKRNSYIFLVSFVVIVTLFMLYIMQASPKSGKIVIIFFALIFYSVVACGAIVGMKIRKARIIEGVPLKDELKNTFKTPEDYKLLDQQIDGKLKRKVILGHATFTFTPHFLIQKIDSLNYIIIKLQNVSFIKNIPIDPKDQKYVYTEFFDDCDHLINKIENYKHNGITFIKICKEQIPWAEIQ